MQNFLDYACTAFPVTKVDPLVDKPDPRPASFYNPEDEAVYDLCKCSHPVTLSLWTDHPKQINLRRSGMLQSVSNSLVGVRRKRPLLR